MTLEDGTFNSEALLANFIKRSKKWVVEQRGRLRENSVPLSTEERRLFSGFFPEEILNLARFTSVPTVSNPDFYSEIPSSFPRLELDRMVAFTFIDTIAESQTVKPSPANVTATRFHELVHVVQGQILGVDAVVEEYLRQWAQSGFSYWGIPLEKQAYRLQIKFYREPKNGFPVVDAVSKDIQTII